MKKYIKTIAAALLLAIPSIGHAAPEDFAESLIEDTINPSFAAHLNRFGTNAYFHSPTHVKMMPYDYYDNCKEVARYLINSLAEDQEANGYLVITTDKTYAVYAGEESTENYTNLVLTMMDDTGSIGGGYISYCLRRADGGAENATFHLLWSEK